MLEHDCLLVDHTEVAVCCQSTCDAELTSHTHKFLLHELFPQTNISAFHHGRLVRRNLDNCTIAKAPDFEVLLSNSHEISFFVEYHFVDSLWFLGQLVPDYNGIVLPHRQQILIVGNAHKVCVVRTVDQVTDGAPFYSNSLNWYVNAFVLSLQIIYVDVGILDRLGN